MAIEAQSEHPLAEAVVNHLKDENIEIQEMIPTNIQDLSEAEQDIILNKISINPNLKGNFISKNKYFFRYRYFDYKFFIAEHIIFDVFFSF